MIEVVWKFFTLNVRRNLRRVLETTHPYLSGIFSFILVYDYLNFNIIIRIPDASNTFITYDTVVFGFTATAIALAIAIPSPTFIKFLSSTSEKTTPFRDFLFILAWNGFIHIVSFFFALPLVIISFDWSQYSSSTALKFYVFIYLWIQIYACFQFMVTTISVYELGDLYANYVAKERRDEDHK